tara:strand:- start:565 stop:975 length:411 start_codon:yes stop_codon:yes gene_type:complete
MQKFLSIPVTAASAAGGRVLIPVQGIVSIVQTSTTKTDIKYANGAAAHDNIELTHTALPTYANSILTPFSTFVPSTEDGSAFSHSMRDLIASSIETALTTSWQSPIIQVRLGENELAGTSTLSSKVVVEITAVTIS